jgi:hypothetical protein
MAEPVCPRLSEAAALLPRLRERVAAMAAAHPLPKGMSFELVPIVEDGAFGYELVPDRRTNTYLMIGRDAAGAPLLRRTLYDPRSPSALALAAVDGRRLSRQEREARFTAQRRDSRFETWSDAVEAAWAQFGAMFPGRPRQPATLSDARNRSLEEALAIALGYLERWDPCIAFCGLPDEAEQGFALKGADGAHGELIFQRPDIWMLRWKAPPDAVYESWSVVLPGDAGGRKAGNGHAS